MAGGGGDGGAGAAREEERLRQERIRAGMSRVGETFGQFDDDFFTGRRQSYLDYATPQLEEQFGDASDDLTFSLARSGNLNSSVRAEKQGDLQKLYDTQLRGINDKAVSFETDARNQVEDARSDITRNLNATADSDAAVSSANARASALAQPAPYSPLTQLFAEFTQGLSTQAGYERAGAIDPRFGGRYNTGLFGPSTDAVRVS